MSKEAAGWTRNPVEIASACLDKLAATVALAAPSGSGRPPSALSSLAGGKAEPAAFAGLYCAMLRARGVRAVPVSGVVVTKDLKAVRHVWAEFWVGGFGWVPADPSIACGYRVPGFTLPDDPRSYYLGNLDNRHIAFLRGWKEYARNKADSVLATAKANPSLQNVFEEAWGGIASYASFWSDVTVVGVY
jgi:transglutaminase-like putative cysteine protease